ncbi:MAG: hypothetical protein LBM38_03785 [Clostridiales bacterium]|jgi:hypothetical protein|nr:hypothetical protein [Clostridiales bacterium]
MYIPNHKHHKRSFNMPDGSQITQEITIRKGFTNSGEVASSSTRKKIAKTEPRLDENGNFVIPPIPEIPEINPPKKPLNGR